MDHQYSGNFGNIVVRPLKEGDIESLRVWRNDPANTKYLSKVPFITSDMQKNWFERYLANAEELQFAICFMDSGELIGSAALYNPDLPFDKIGCEDSGRDISMRAELGKIMIGAADAHGKHAGVSSVEAMAKIAFEDIGLSELQLHVYCDNVPAVKVYLQAGFAVRDKHVTADGREEYLMIKGKQGNGCK